MTSVSGSTRAVAVEAHLAEARERWAVLRAGALAACAHPDDVILHADATLRAANDLDVLDPGWRAR